MKILVDATLTICLKDVPVDVPDGIAGKRDYEDVLADLVMQKAEKKLVFLDSKGSVSGNEGHIEHTQCDGVDNWSNDE